MVGVVLGLIGAVVVITKGGSVGLADGIKPGHLMALACAFIWSGYSVLSRRFGHVPTDVVAGFCLVTAVVTLVLHVTLEPTVWPASTGQWAAVVLLGAAPLGAAFYAWDYGVKHGDIMVLGALSYAAPLLSTIVLLAAGFVPSPGRWRSPACSSPSAPSWRRAICCSAARAPASRRLARGPRSSARKTIGTAWNKTPGHAFLRVGGG